MIRVACFIDGFNLYHSLKRLKAQHLKWVDLHKLMCRQIAARSERVSAVYYFSAFADWLPAERQRHEEYVRALESTGVQPILGQFKEKDRSCKTCGAHWKGHEEKETDVNIALWLINEAYRDTYDKALIVSRDSDLKPALQMVRSQFAEKELTVVAPPNSGHSNDLIGVAHSKRKITVAQVADCLFPQQVLCPTNGTVLATRPAKFDPPP
ncbi:MAG TPA: NYN domain-containing protein [Caulobacteraceae bacterium]